MQWFGLCSSYAFLLLGFDSFIGWPLLLALIWTEISFVSPMLWFYWSHLGVAGSTTRVLISFWSSFADINSFNFLLCLPNYFPCLLIFLIIFSYNCMFYVCLFSALSFCFCNSSSEFSCFYWHRRAFCFPAVVNVTWLVENMMDSLLLTHCIWIFISFGTCYSGSHEFQTNSFFLHEI